MKDTSKGPFRCKECGQLSYHWEGYGYCADCWKPKSFHKRRCIEREAIQELERRIGLQVVDKGQPLSEPDKVTDGNRLNVATVVRELIDNVVSFKTGGQERIEKALAVYIPADLPAWQGWIKAIKEAVDPVRSWFDGDGEIQPPPTDIAIARMAVEELVKDRDELITARNDVLHWKAMHAAVVDRCGKILDLIYKETQGKDCATFASIVFIIDNAQSPA